MKTDTKLMELIQRLIDKELLTGLTITPSKGISTGITKVTARKVIIKERANWQFEVRLTKQVRHINVSNVGGVFLDQLETLLDQCSFSTLNLKTTEGMYQVVANPDRETVKIIHHSSKVDSTVRTEATSHNRTKNYIIPEGQPLNFLQELGVMDASGRVLQPMRRKFVQINRFLEIVDDIYYSLPNRDVLRIVDFGCGKSYLTFAMYYYFTVIKERTVDMVGLDLKEQVIEDCNKLAANCGFTKLRFETGSIEEYRQGYADTDMVVTLHACDTATDAALEKAVLGEVPVILSVPCCQHELNGQIQNETLAPLLKYGLLKERFSALLTDALRARILELCGYKVDIIEFVDMEHTPKNLMIKAVYTGEPPSALKRREYDTLVGEMQVHPWLERLAKRS